MFQLTSILRATWILIDFNEDLYSNKLEPQRLHDYFTEVPLYKRYRQTLIERVIWFLELSFWTLWKAEVQTYKWV